MSIKAAHLRIARATDNLSAIVSFYKDGLGFDIVASFEDHDGIDGVMLGHKGMPYHLEFTSSPAHKAGRAPNKDDLLVFYLPVQEHWLTAVQKMECAGYEAVQSFNPYWDVKGKTFEDADGYRVVLQNADWNM